MTDYVFKGIEPDDVVISALITAIKPSLDKEDYRGGAREGAGRKSNEIKINQNNSKQSNEIKINQKNQSFLETETETETGNNISGDQIDLEEVIAEKKKAKPDYSAEFEAWWVKYPNKKSKQDAQKAFARVLEKKQATFAELMSGLEAYTNDCKVKNTETHYIKHPSTWLNQGCWADEYSEKIAVQDEFIPRADAEKTRQMASIAEATRLRMLEQAKLKFGA